MTSSRQVVGEELEEGLVYTVSLRKVPVHRGPGQGQRWFQVRAGAEGVPEAAGEHAGAVVHPDHHPRALQGFPTRVLAQLWFSVKAEDPSPLGPARPLEEERGGPREGESRAVRTVQAGRWEALAEHLVPALQEGDLGYVHTFLGTYLVFASTEQVLDRLFHRYGGDLGGRGEPRGRLDVKTTLCALLGTWMDQYRDDCLQPPDSPCLQLLAAHAREHLPGSGPQCRVALLLAQMRHPEPTEAEPEAPAADTGPEPESAPSPPGLPAGEVAPAPAVQIEPDAFRAVAPAPELQVAPAPPPLPPTEMGPVPSLGLDHPTRSAGAAAQEPRAAAAPSGAGAAEPGASPAPPASPPLHGSALPALEGEPAPPAAEAPAGELEEASGPPPLPPVGLAPVPPTEAEPAPSAGAAPSAPAVGEGEAVPPPPPVPPALVAAVPTLELQPVQAPSGAAALEGEARLAAAPEPRPELSSAAGQAAPQQPSCPWPGTCGDGLREQKPELLAFPPELVAEQLSLMDAELFKKVVPHHCLGSIWSQRHQKGKEHVAPTVRAVISQLNRVADCVVATCLGDRSMKAADRARVVEHWIEVARECRALPNFSSAHAILSALDSHAIGRQKKTWAEVSRASFRLFQTLSGIVSTEINASLGSELISQEGNPKFATLDAKPNRTQKQQQQQEGGAIQVTVPWLGTFLTQFLIVDSAMPEFLDCTVVNFDKRGKEDQLVAELQQQQARCCYDCLVPDGRFGAWFEAVEQLGQKDSLLLSREWEPLPESASEASRPNSRRKAASLGVESEFPLRGRRGRQGPDAESSGSGSSTVLSSVQLQGGPDLSGGDAADSPHPHRAGSSGSAVEIHLDHVPEAQDGQEAKAGQPTSASSQIGSTVTAASGGSSSSSIQARANRTSRKPRDSRPRSKRHVGDRCFVQVALAEDSGHKVQSILVTDQDRAPAVIRKALEEHQLAGEQPEDYQLVQILSGDGTLQIPDDANVYYAMAPSPDYRFLLRKTTPLDAKVKERALSALRGSRQKGPRFQKGKV
ncbi:ral guanine nucleotide dissociation stimulator-like [Dasypus novemcinctus]|uniref:ral guanine nucleotide dissociation stimulator-like n=1 Tax=Dasypus novemcinctus TaxID=9361 RepID=UPI00265F6BDD|nr:ral guanine nucleotide dissociation stimulator-like [Dasypus novemcinctus]